MNVKGLLVAAAVGAVPFVGMAAASAAPVPTTPMPEGPMIAAGPDSVLANDNGDISFTVTGWSLEADTTVKVNSSGLAQACTGGVNVKDRTVKVDRLGRFNIAVSGIGCLPGTYSIETTQTRSPFHSWTTKLVVNQ